MFNCFCVTCLTAFGSIGIVPIGHVAYYRIRNVKKRGWSGLACEVLGGTFIFRLTTVRMNAYLTLTQQHNEQLAVDGWRLQDMNRRMDTPGNNRAPPPVASWTACTTLPVATKKPRNGAQMERKCHTLLCHELA